MTDGAAHRRTVLAMLGSAGVSASLAGCTGGLIELPGTGPGADLYDLTPKSSFSNGLPTVRWQIVIEEPLAASAVNTDRIALKPTQIEIKYYAQARWVDRAPRLVQTRMVESFENTGKIVAVGRQAIGLSSDFNIKSELREFQAEYYNGNVVPTVHVQLNIKIVREPQGLIIASQSFEYRQQASADEITEIVRTFDLALGKVLKRSIEWSLRKIDEVAPEGPPKLHGSPPINGSASAS